MSWSQVVAWRQSAGRQIVFTNGVFDLLHRGHVDVLAAARAQGDALVVGVNDDASVRRLKGDTRPLCGVSDRAYVLAALETVDAVVIFGQETPAELIAVIRPEVLVKGGDYTASEVVGAREVVSWGGRVVIVPLTPGQSTTSIIRHFDNAK